MWNTLGDARIAEINESFARAIAQFEPVNMCVNQVDYANAKAVFDKDENIGIAYGMGLTAERVAQRWKVSREAQDAFALASHQKALAAQQAGEFSDEITPVEVTERYPDLATGLPGTRSRTVALEPAASLPARIVDSTPW